MLERSRVLRGRKGTRLTFLGRGKGVFCPRGRNKVATRTLLGVVGESPGESFLFLFTILLALEAVHLEIGLPRNW